MEKTEMILAAGAAAAGKKAAFGSALFSSMVIFNDPAYLIVAAVGGFVSMGMAYYDFIMIKEKAKQEERDCIHKLHLELSRAFALGLIFSLLSFTLLLSSGDNIVKYLSNNKLATDTLPSVWMIITIIIATNANGMYLRIKKLLGGSK